MDAHGHRVILLGTGALMPSNRRGLSASLLVTKKDHILVDCGMGTSQRLKQAGIHPTDLSKILITHLHIGHCSELAQIIVEACGLHDNQVLALFGPKGIRASVESMLVNHRAPGEVVKRAMVITEIEPATCLSHDGEITCTPVEHGESLALGYRIETSEGSIGFSGDTSPCDRLIALIRGVDLLIHECTFPDHCGLQAKHTIPSQLGFIGQSAGVRRLAMTHFAPICDEFRESMIASVGAQYHGDIIFGEDLMSLSIF